MKKTTKTITSLGLAAGILVAVPPFTQAKADTLSGQVTVNAANLYLRSGNSFDAKPVRVLHNGETYKVFAESNGMYNIGGNQWVTASSKYVSFSPSDANVAPTSQVAPKVVTVEVANVFIRSDASFTSRPVDVAHKGQSFPILDERNGLYQIGPGRWITATTKYVSTSANGVASSATVAPNPSPVVSENNLARTVVVNVANVFIRSDASFTSKAVDVAHYGQSFTILGESNGLYQIGPNRWITASSKYVTTTDQSPNVSSTSTPAPAPTPAPTPTPTPIISSSPTVTTPTSNIQQIISLGERFMGMPYVWGSSNPSNGGFDCSGFVYYLFKNNGYNIPRLSVAGYWNMVQHVSTPQVGDLVFFQNTYTSGPSHIGIYLGNGKFLNANDSGIEISDLSYSYWQNHFLGYGRF